MIPFAVKSFRYFVFKSNVGQIKCFSVFRVAGLNILGREGTHNYYYFFWEKKYSFIHFLSKCIYLYFFSKKPDSVNLGRVGLP